MAVSEDSKVDQIRRDFIDLDFTVIATPRQYVVDFEVYEIEAYTDDPANGGAPLWHRKDSPSHPDVVEEIGDAEIYIRGHVKWGGCSNWTFTENERGVMLHGCSRGNLSALGEVLARCWDLTGELMPNWDGSP